MNRLTPKLLGVGALTAILTFAAPFAGLGGVAHADDGDFPAALSAGDAGPYSVVYGIPPGQTKNPAGAICTTAPQLTPNVNTDCEDIAPHNETSLAVNPTNPMNIIESANDYQLVLTGGDKNVHETVLSRAHVTFDGGHTWTMYPLVLNAYNASGDPSVAFDASGRAYIATLGFRFAGPVNGVNADVVVNASTDGGKTWNVSRVANGTGSFGSVGKFNDKEYIAAWGNGNAIVTWTQFNQVQKGATVDSQLYDSVTHDGGRTWSAPQLIGGSSPYCASVEGQGICDEATGTTPAVARDGSIYVSFLNTDVNAQDPNNLNYNRDDYFVVKVDPSTGRLIAGPFMATGVVDGQYDYPMNVDGRYTYQDSEFRTWSLGNITADPTNALHLAVVWSDMRNSLHAPSVQAWNSTYSNPYAVTTNSDVVVTQSFDGGTTWSAPHALAVPNDQFMPWAAYDASGKLRIGYFDRSYDTANHLYGYTLASEMAAGSLAFTSQQVTTALSDPTMNDRWFATTANPAFPHATTFLGDYSNIAVNPAGGVVLSWTDMRNDVTFPSRTGHGEDAYFATAP